MKRYENMKKSFSMRLFFTSFLFTNILFVYVAWYIIPKSRKRTTIHFGTPFSSTTIRLSDIPVSIIWRCISKSPFPEPIPAKLIKSNPETLDSKIMKQNILYTIYILNAEDFLQKIISQNS